MQVPAHKLHTMKPSEEYLDKLGMHIQQVTLAALMNNTKWREVFACLSTYDLLIRIRSVYGFLGYWISTSAIANQLYIDGIGDCISGGPILFKEIAYISISVKQPPNRKIDISLLEQIIESLNQLGQLQLTQDDKELRIYGYLMSPSVAEQVPVV